MAQSVSGRYSGNNISGDAEWEVREAQRQRELEEARARAAQMEKTMKWWSDCTANWREKWSKVRNERNKAREEVKQLRANLEATMKEANSYKREKNDLEMQITQLKNEMEKIHSLMMKHAGQFNKASTSDTGEEAEGNGRDANCSPDISSDGLKNVNSEDGLVTKASNGGRFGSSGVNSDVKDVDIEDFVLKGAIPKRITTIDEAVAEETRLIQQLSKDEFDEDYLLQKISMLQIHLDEAQKTAQAEKEENHILHKNIEKLTMEIQGVRECQEDLRAAKQEAVRELLTLQEQHSAEMRIINNTLQEEIVSRENLERRLSELRTELERLQAENASEWGKRERLETEKINLERDNKKLRTEIRDYQDRFDRKVRPLQAVDIEVRTLQQELSERNKELSELKISYSKLKKLLSEKNTDLEHTVRRAEQYETEVKRLRQRVEELKRELAAAEDEIDSTASQVRRLQRANDELTAQTENLQLQLQQNRPLPKPPVRGSSIANGACTNSNGGSNCSGNIQYRNNIVAVELPNECLPNINDLRQIFDETPTQNNNIGIRTSSNSGSGCVDALAKRSSHTERTLMQQQQNGNNGLFDIRSAHIEEQDTKSRNLDFERVKQKFDNPMHLHHQYRHHQREQRERSSSRTNNGSVGISGNQSMVTTNNRANLVLPLKSITTTINSNIGDQCKENVNGNSLPNSLVNASGKDDDQSRLSLTGGGNVGNGNVIDNIVKFKHENSAPTTIDCNYSPNGVNLDSLKVSDNETP